MTNVRTQTPTPSPQTGTSIPEDPFEGREFGGYVFRDRHDRNFFIGRMTSREREKWLRDHPDRWQTREEFFRERQARAGNDFQVKPTKPCSTTSATEVPTSAEPDGRLPVAHTAPQGVSIAEALIAAG